MIQGFSKFSKEEKIDYLVKHNNICGETLKSFWHPDNNKQKLFDEFSENTLTNYFIPYGIVPNVLVNDKTYCIPMAIEESSVVAAASNAAKFWFKKGGVKTQIVGVEKVGQIHFLFDGSPSALRNYFLELKPELLDHLKADVANMERRGGGILGLDLLDKRDHLENYYQLYFTFDTCDAMGANFINTILESSSQFFRQRVQEYFFKDKLEIIMSILSNYTPNCRVKAWVNSPQKEIDFAEKFISAIKIAKVDIHRAVTHNKGILNGIDALTQATGNDFRAVEACIHAYAQRNGSYQSLSDAYIKDDQFYFSLEIPLALGTVGGLTSLHPLAHLSFKILNFPNSSELMQLTAALGLLQNFAAIRSLVTCGIQKGHMKMHLMNILNKLGASEEEFKQAKEYFTNKAISYGAVKSLLRQLRNLQ